MVHRKSASHAGKGTHIKHQLSQKEPEYMVQVSDAKMLRKDILESLREVIIFMQGYEKFRSIQEEKVLAFHKLKMQTQELQTLIAGKLRRDLPKGKLKPLVPKLAKAKSEEHHEEMEMPEDREEIPQQTASAAPRLTSEAKAQQELDELEQQLREIEGQLQGMGK